MLKTLRRLIRLPKLPWRKPKNKRQPIKRKSTRKQQKVIDGRKDKLRRRKNFLPSLILTIVLWVLLVGIIYFIDPSTPGIIPLFFILLFLCITFTASFLFINTRLGIITGIFSVMFVVLRYFGIGNALNAVLIIALAIVTEYYFRN